jgi:hypothetical protein
VSYSGWNLLIQPGLNGSFAGTPQVRLGSFPMVNSRSTLVHLLASYIWPKLSPFNWWFFNPTSPDLVALVLSQLLWNWDGKFFPLVYPSLKFILDAIYSCGFRIFRGVVIVTSHSGFIYIGGGWVSGSEFNRSCASVNGLVRSHDPFFFFFPVLSAVTALW